MRLTGRFLLSVAVLGLLAPPVFAKGNANFVLGNRLLHEDGWEPLDEQPAFGANVDFGKEGWPVTIVLGAHASSEDETLGGLNIELELTEFSVGVQKTWDQYEKARPYISGGLTFISGEFTGTIGPLSGSVDDDSTALFVDGGIFWRLGTRFNIGLNGRLVTGSEIDIAGVEVDVDYSQVGLILGWGW